MFKEPLITATKIGMLWQNRAMIMTEWKDWYSIILAQVGSDTEEGLGLEWISSQKLS